VPTEGITTFMDQILSNPREPDTLVADRNTLLPKLISREVGVHAAEQFIGQAV